MEMIWNAKLVCANITFIKQKQFDTADILNVLTQVCLGLAWLSG